MQTITAMFDSRAEAEKAQSRLVDAGVHTSNVTIHDKSSIGTAAQPVNSSASGGESDGRDGTHRNAIGDYIDDRTGERLMSDAGSERTALGDYIEGSDASHASALTHTGSHAGNNDNEGSGVWSQVKAFFSGNDASYEEAMRRGGFVLTARVDEADADRASAALDGDDVVDLTEREMMWRGDGWAGNGNERSGSSRVRSYVGHDTMPM